MGTPSTATPAMVRVGRERNARAMAVAALGATIGLGALGWVLTIQRTRGMDMGVATTVGTFPYFVSMWVPMMAAMMLPGTAPAVRRLALAGSRTLDLARYLGAYLAIWALVGFAVYGLYRPHGTLAAGAIILAAGAYELTPVKRRARELCRERMSSGWQLGLCCVASNVALMVMLVALGVMSLTWMAVVGGVMLIQKLLPPRRAIDISVVTAIIALGLAVIFAPSSVPGLVAPM